MYSIPPFSEAYTFVKLIWDNSAKLPNQNIAPPSIAFALSNTAFVRLPLLLAQ